MTIANFGAVPETAANFNLPPHPVIVKQFNIIILLILAETPSLLLSLRIGFIIEATSTIAFTALGGRYER
jgi:hypothetical protein